MNGSSTEDKAKSKVIEETAEQFKTEQTFSLNTSDASIDSANERLTIDESQVSSEADIAKNNGIEETDGQLDIKNTDPLSNNDASIDSTTKQHTLDKPQVSSAVDTAKNNDITKHNNKLRTKETKPLAKANLDNIFDYFSKLEIFLKTAYKDSGDLIPLNEEDALFAKQIFIHSKNTSINFINDTKDKLKYLRLIDELKKKRYLHYFIGSSKTAHYKKNHSRENIAKNLAKAAINHDCNPLDALKFVELNNEDIQKNLISNITRNHQTFLNSEHGSLQNAFILVAIGLISYLLTVFQVVPLFFGASFMTTIGLIGIFTAETIILKKTTLLEKNPSKVWQCITLNTLIVAMSLLSIIFVPVSPFLSLGLIGTISPLMAQFYHQKIIVKYIKSKPIDMNDAKYFLERIDNYQLSSIFHINDQITLNIGEDSPKMSPSK